MAEWSIALPWKGSNRATGSGVRIPVSPPLSLFKELHFSFMYDKIAQSQFLNELKKFYRDIFDALSMLNGLEQDLNIKHFTPK